MRASLLTRAGVLVLIPPAARASRERGLARTRGARRQPRRAGRSARPRARSARTRSGSPISPRACTARPTSPRLNLTPYLSAPAIADGCVHDALPELVDDARRRMADRLRELLTHQALALPPVAWVHAGRPHRNPDPGADRGDPRSRGRAPPNSLNRTAFIVLRSRPPRCHACCGPTVCQRRLPGRRGGAMRAHAQQP